MTTTSFGACWWLQIHMGSQSAKNITQDRTIQAIISESGKNTQGPGSRLKAKWFLPLYEESCVQEKLTKGGFCGILLPH